MQETEGFLLRLGYDLKEALRWSLCAIFIFQKSC